MNTYTLPRTGDAPLRFSGELIAEADGERQNGREQNRWHELRVYRSAVGGYVVAITYRTRWQGEASRDTVVVRADAAGVADFFRHHDPVAGVRGYPDHEQYRDKQARLLADLKERFEGLVSEVLVGDEFAEDLT